MDELAKQALHYSSNDSSMAVRFPLQSPKCFSSRYYTILKKDIERRKYVCFHGVLMNRNDQVESERVPLTRIMESHLGRQTSSLWSRHNVRTKNTIQKLYPWLEYRNVHQVQKERSPNDFGNGCVNHRADYSSQLGFGVQASGTSRFSKARGISGVQKTRSLRYWVWFVSAIFPPLFYLGRVLDIPKTTGMKCIILTNNCHVGSQTSGDFEKNPG